MATLALPASRRISARRSALTAGPDGRGDAGADGTWRRWWPSRARGVERVSTSTEWRKMK
eukprot:4441819-Pyramimonas_sp.AAC.1